MIYLDYASTSLLHPDVKKSMFEAWNEWGNPSSIHILGQKNKKKLNNLREEAKQILNVKNNAHLIFTSSATESNNLVLHNSKLPILISQFEHSSIKNFPNVEVIDIFNLELLEEKLKQQSYLICCMLVQHETGIKFDTSAIAQLALKYESKLHIDASQAKNIDFDSLNCSSLTMCAHKLGGPIGIAALITKSILRPQLHGGKQEYDMRSSTQNIPLIAGFVESLKIKHDYKLLKKLFLEKIDKKFLLSSYVDHKFCDHIFCLVLPIAGTELVVYMDLNNIAIAYGSACNSGSSAGMEGINALKHLNHPYLISEHGARVSFGFSTSENDVLTFCNLFNKFIEYENIYLKESQEH